MTPEPKSKFAFYEVVRFRKDPRVPPELGGREAAIVAMARDDEGRWFYTVSIEGYESCRIVSEDVLESTGKFKSRDNFHTAESIRVSVNPKTGSGKISGTNK